MTKENLLEIFNIFDINHDGKIDISEFTHVLPSVDERDFRRFSGSQNLSTDDDISIMGKKQIKAEHLEEHQDELTYND